MDDYKKQLQELSKEYIGDIMCDDWLEKISKLLESAREEEKVKIQDDIKSVLNFLDGDTDRTQIANYVREYLLAEQSEEKGITNS